MMEKFAERYFNDNPGQLFENAGITLICASPLPAGRVVEMLFSFFLR